MRAFALLGLLALVSVQALPAKREHNSKLSRQEPVPVAPVTKVETKPVVQKVAAILPLDTGSLAPVGEVIEVQPKKTTTLKPIEVEITSTTNPLGDPKAPPPPKVSIPQVNVTGLTYPESFPPGGGPARPPPSTPPPTTTTKKPEEEDSSSEEEEQGPPGPPGPPGGSEEEGQEGPPGGPPGPPPGAEEETANQEETEDDNEQEDEEEDEDVEDVEDEEEDEEAQAGAKRRANLPRGVPQPQPNLVAMETQPNLNALADSNLDAFIPGYITPHGEVLVPIDTLEHAMPYSIIPDKQIQRARLGIARQEFRDESSEEVDDTQNEDSASAEDDEDTTSEEEEDDSLPVRINSFNIIYENQKKKKDKEDKQEEEVISTETDEVDGGEEPVEEVRPPEPTNPPRPPPISDGSALIIGGSKEKPEPLPKQPTEEDLKRRPPPLAYVPATRPTNEDDENEFRHINFRSLLPPSVHPGYRYFYPEPTYAYEPYSDDVSQEYYGYY